MIMAFGTLTRRQHDGELGRLRSEMNDLFNGFFRGMDWPWASERAWPAIDVAEKDDAIVVRAEVPGCKPDDIEVSIHGRTLTVSGQKEETKEQKEKGYYHSESVYGSFRRDVDLPAEVDQSKVEATCKNGVLSITLPKTEQVKPVKIQIKG
jgi:HSP20 family protein